MKAVMKKFTGLLVALLFIKTAFAQETIEVVTDVCVLQLDKTNGNLVRLHWNNPDEEISKKAG